MAAPSEVTAWICEAGRLAAKALKAAAVCLARLDILPADHPGARMPRLAEFLGPTVCLAEILKKLAGATGKASAPLLRQVPSLWQK